MLRIVLGLEDVYRGDASLLPRGRAAGEVLQPRVEVGDPVLDVQHDHGPVLDMAARCLGLLISFFSLVLCRRGPLITTDAQTK